MRSGILFVIVFTIFLSLSRCIGVECISGAVQHDAHCGFTYFVLAGNSAGCVSLFFFSFQTVAFHFSSYAQARSHAHKHKYMHAMHWHMHMHSHTLAHLPMHTTTHNSWFKPFFYLTLLFVVV